MPTIGWPASFDITCDNNNQEVTLYINSGFGLEIHRCDPGDVPVCRFPTVTTSSLTTSPITSSYLTTSPATTDAITSADMTTSQSTSSSVPVTSLLTSTEISGVDGGLNNLSGDTKKSSVPIIAGAAAGGLVLLLLALVLIGM